MLLHSCSNAPSKSSGISINYTWTNTTRVLTPFFRPSTRTVFWYSSIPIHNLLSIKQSGVTWNIFCFVYVGCTLTCKQRPLVSSWLSAQCSQKWCAFTCDSFFPGFVYTLHTSLCSCLLTTPTDLLIEYHVVSNQLGIGQSPDIVISIIVSKIYHHTVKLNHEQCMRNCMTTNSYFPRVTEISHEMPEGTESFRSSIVMRF